MDLTSAVSLSSASLLWSKATTSQKRVEFSTLRKVYSSWHRHLLLPFQKWKNPFLAWKPEDYNGIKNINVDPKLVWKPDLVLYNK